MGVAYYSREERLRAEEATRKRLEKEDKVRKALAAKIVLALSNRITTVIIRPGPDAEERECYQMAQELLDASEDLTATVLRIIEIEDNA